MEEGQEEIIILQDDNPKLIFYALLIPQRDRADQMKIDLEQNGLLSSFFNI